MASGVIRFEAIFKLFNLVITFMIKASTTEDICKVGSFIMESFNDKGTRNAEHDKSS